MGYGQELEFIDQFESLEHWNTWPGAQGIPHFSELEDVKSSRPLTERGKCQHLLSSSAVLTTASSMEFPRQGHNDHLHGQDS